MEFGKKLYGGQKKSKYNNKKIMVDGIKFDSVKEAKRYRELVLLEKAGEINNLELQPRFTLLDGFKYGGETIRKLTYVADFKYYDKKIGRDVVEDTKGYKTDVYQIKRKLFLYKYGKDVIFIES